MQHTGRWNWTELKDTTLTHKENGLNPKLLCFFFYFFYFISNVSTMKIFICWPCIKMDKIILLNVYDYLINPWLKYKNKGYKMKIIWKLFGCLNLLHATYMELHRYRYAIDDVDFISVKYLLILSLNKASCSIKWETKLHLEKDQNIHNKECCQNSIRYWSHYCCKGFHIFFSPH